MNKLNRRVDVCRDLPLVAMIKLAVVVALGAIWLWASSRARR
jgi:hypothetical protein